MHARVLPALGPDGNGMAIAVARPGSDPDAALEQALGELDPRLGPEIDAYLATEDEPVARVALLAATAGPRRLLCVDQLEEVFLQQADEHGPRTRFFERLAALGHVSGVAILLGMRADFYGDLMRSPMWDEFKHHRVELAPLRGAALRQAITRPAEVVGVHVEVDLVVCQKLIASSCGAPVVEVEQSAEPLAAFDRRVLIGGSHRVLGGREQPIADALMVALKVIVLDIL